MANVSRTGFSLVKNPGGSGQMQPESHPVASAWQGTCNAIPVDMWVGDPVCLLANGTVDYAAAGTAYAAQTRFYGVVVAIEQWWDVNNNVMQRGLGNRLPGGVIYGTNYEHESRVLVQPFKDGQVWEVEFDISGAAVTYATYIAYRAIRGGNVELLLTRASAALRRSFICLDDATVNVTATLPFRILDIPERTSAGPQDYASTYVKAHVTANFAQQIPVGTTTGI